MTDFLGSDSYGRLSQWNVLARTVAGQDALILRTAWELDTDSAAASQLTSVSKTFVAEAVNRVVDRAVRPGRQSCSGAADG
ncbi:hypothetical protein ACFY64_15170 [Streptomyces collinus]|uniref:hypothetical protein n=1 Tax=Streptomyces collinus TaxID=42684 RepID=UPI00369D3CD8